MYVVWSFTVYLLALQNTCCFQPQGWFLMVSQLTHTYVNLLLLTLSYSFLMGYVSVVSGFYFFVKLNYYTTYYQRSIIVTQLLTGYNVIHPVLFYGGFVGCLVYTLKFNSVLFFQKKGLLQVTSWALLLGGWWGVGNSTWGFFWVNDLIEITLLCLICLLAYLLHISSSKKTQFYVWLVSILLVSFLFCLRLGFLFTRHNFFNLRGLNNISAGFFLQLTQSTWLVIVSYWLLSFAYYIIWVIGCYCLSFFSDFLFYQLRHVYFHSLFFIIFLFWVRYKSNLFTIFRTINFTTITTQVYLLKHWVLVKNKISHYTTMKLITLCLTSASLYNTKLLFTVYLVFTSYVSILIWLCVIISILKIYFK